MSIILETPKELAQKISRDAKEKRLSLNLSQQSLSQRSGVSYGVVKKFEQSGKISFESLLKIALVLNSLGNFADLFKKEPLESLTTMDQILDQKNRKRGRK